MNKVRVLLADDHAILREGLCALLSLEKDLRVVGQAGDGVEAVRLVKESKAQVIVMDIGMPGLNGIEATRQVLNAVPGVRVIALSIHNDRRFVLGMVSAGAKGYLLKNCAANELVRAIRQVMRGETYLCEDIRDILADDYLQRIQTVAPPSLFDLSEREREVARLLSLGQTNKGIAMSLGLSPKTVETHRLHIMDKLNLHSVADLTRFAIREGLVAVDE